MHTFKTNKVGAECTTADGKNGIINPAKECTPLIATASRMANPSSGLPVGRWTCYGAGYAYHSNEGCKGGEWGYYTKD